MASPTNRKKKSKRYSFLAKLVAEYWFAVKLLNIFEPENFSSVSTFWPWIFSHCNKEKKKKSQSKATTLREINERHNSIKQTKLSNEVKNQRNRKKKYTVASVEKPIVPFDLCFLVLNEFAFKFMCTLTEWQTHSQSHAQRQYIAGYHM